MRTWLESLPEGHPSSGGKVFENENCQGCHSLEPGEERAGPSLAGSAERATAARPDYSAELYLYVSILHSQAHVASGFPGGTMPANYQSKLSEQELADVITFLMTR